ncbi:MAG: phage tail protein [Cellvibrionaceae bacterium]
MIDLKLPVWGNKGELEKLKIAATGFWSTVESWTGVILQNLDPLTCSEGVLDVVAWGRHVERFKDEPLALYRKRVAFALLNARDAGSYAGLKRIFERLGMGYVDIEERIEGQAFDIVIVRLTDSAVAANTELLQLVLTLYGRTCRRYQIEVITPINSALSATEFNIDYSYSVAS